METSSLIPILAMSTFAVVIALFAWSYFRTRKAQEKRDEL